MNTVERIKFVLNNRPASIHLAKIMAGKYLHLPFRPYPFILQIDLDSVCDIDCFFCAYKGREDKPAKYDIATLDKISKAISEAKYISLSAWGEPLVSPNLNAVLDKIFSLNNSRELIALVTNGTKLSPEIASMITGHLASLTISLNAATEETYNRNMRRGDWRKTIEAIKSFMASLTLGDKRKVRLHMVAHAENIWEIPLFVSLADVLNIGKVRVDQFTVNMAKYQGLSLVNEKEKYNQFIRLAREKAQVLGMEFIARQFGNETGESKCLSPWMEFNVWADGRVAPCCCNGTWFLGNVFESSFESVWFGEGYRELRKQPDRHCLSCPKILPFDDERAHISPFLLEQYGGEK